MLYPLRHHKGRGIGGGRVFGVYKENGVVGGRVLKRPPRTGQPRPGNNSRCQYAQGMLEILCRTGCLKAEYEVASKCGGGGGSHLAIVRHNRTKAFKRNTRPESTTKNAVC